MNIKNSVLDYIRYKHKLAWPHAKDGPRKAPQKNFRMVPTWKTKTSEFLDAGGYNRNESAGNWRLGMGRQRGVKKKKLI